MPRWECGRRARIRGGDPGVRRWCRLRGAEQVAAAVGVVGETRRAAGEPFVVSAVRRSRVQRLRRRLGWCRNPALKGPSLGLLSRGRRPLLLRAISR